MVARAGCCADCKQLIRQVQIGGVWTPRRCENCAQRWDAHVSREIDRRSDNAKANYITRELREAGVLTPQLVDGTQDLTTFTGRSDRRYDQAVSFLRAHVTTYLNLVASGHPRELPWFVIYGDRGCGKTFIGEALVNLAVRDHLGTAMIKSTEMFWMESRDAMGEHAEDNVFFKYVGKHLLVLDDMGLKDPTRKELNQLRHLLDYRYRSRYPTGFTNNKSLNELVTFWSEADADAAKLIVDRIQQLADGNIIELRGKSHRSRKQQAAE